MSKIAIIGAGPMGLAVAYHLLLAGQKVVIFEAGKEIGGMTVSFDFGGLKIERFYHFICKSDTPLFELLDELGIKNKLRWTDTKMGFYYNGKLYPWGNPVALLKFPELGLISKLRYGLMAFIATKRTDWRRLDKMNAVNWITRWVGKRAYNVLWKSLFDLKFYQFSNNLSAAWIWTRIRRVGTSRKSLMVESMGYMKGGSETIIIRLREVIEDMGGEIQVSTPVEKVLIEHHRVTGVRVHNESRQFNIVVSTVPTPYVSRMIPDLPDEIIQKFNNLKNIAVVCVMVKLKVAVTENFWLNINDERMDIPGIVEYSNLNRLDPTIVYVPYYMPADNPMYLDPDEKFFEKVKSYIKLINPDIKDSDFIDFHASRYKHAQPICEPEFMSKLPEIKLPIDGLYAADTSYYYPEDRSISESVKLGKEIANMIVTSQ